METPEKLGPRTGHGHNVGVSQFIQVLFSNLEMPAPIHIPSGIPIWNTFTLHVCFFSFVFNLKYLWQKRRRSLFKKPIDVSDMAKTSQWLTPFVSLTVFEAILSDDRSYRAL